jgi:hypothetical protein
MAAQGDVEVGLSVLIRKRGELDARTAEAGRRPIFMTVLATIARLGHNGSYGQSGSCVQRRGPE